MYVGMVGATIGRYPIIGFVMSGQPQTIYNGIMKQINALKRSGVDPLSSLRIEREAQKLVKVNAVQGYMALGALAALNHDVAGVKAWHDKTLHLAKNNASVLYNYAVSLHIVGLNAEAAAFAKPAMELASDKNYAGLFLRATIGAGKLMEAFECVQQLPALSGEFAGLAAAVSYMRLQGITDDDIVPIAKVAEEVILDAKVPSVTVELSSDEESIALVFMVSESDGQKLAAMDTQLAEKIAAIESKPGVASSVVMYFRSVQ